MTKGLISFTRSHGQAFLFLVLDEYIEECLDFNDEHVQYVHCWCEYVFLNKIIMSLCPKTKPTQNIKVYQKI